MTDDEMFAEFDRITSEELRRDRIARGEASHKELMRFCRDEMDSPPAPEGVDIHPSHRPQTLQEAAENPEGRRYCLDCCVMVSGPRSWVAVRGGAPCAGKRTMLLGDDDRLHWVPVP